VLEVAHLSHRSVAVLARYFAGTHLALALIYEHDGADDVVVCSVASGVVFARAVTRLPTHIVSPKYHVALCTSFAHVIPRHAVKCEAMKLSLRTATRSARAQAELRPLPHCDFSSDELCHLKAIFCVV